MSAPSDGRARVLLETPITFDVVGDVVHAPMVRAIVGKTPTKLILDTGSSDHVLTIELANRAGLRSDSGEPGTDHTGASIASWTLGKVPIDIDGTVLHLLDAVAIEAPGPFERWGVGGLLSPQKLHPSAFVVIDLVENALVLVEGDIENTASWLRARHPLLEVLSLERQRGGVVAVRASIEPNAGVATILDTGDSGTEFAHSAVPGLRGARETAGFGVGGAGVEGEKVTGQTLRVGDALFPLEVLFVRAHIAEYQGIVGMDVLRGTVLAVSADVERPVLWLVPASSEGR